MGSLQHRALRVCAGCALLAGVLAANAMPAQAATSVYESGSTLYVIGGSNADSINITTTASLRVENITANVTPGAGCARGASAGIANCSRSGISALVVETNGGNDRVDQGAVALTGYGMNATIRGGNGNDNLLGGYGPDIIYGGADDDSINDRSNNFNSPPAFGNADNVLAGEGGRDTVFASASAYSDDIVIGGPGQDSGIGGGGGNDYLDSYDGNTLSEYVYCGDGNDQVKRDNADTASSCESRVF